MCTITHQTDSITQINPLWNLMELELSFNDLKQIFLVVKCNTLDIINTESDIAF